MTLVGIMVISLAYDGCSHGNPLYSSFGSVFYFEIGVVVPMPSSYYSIFSRRRECGKVTRLSDFATWRSDFATWRSDFATFPSSRRNAVLYLSVGCLAPAKPLNLTRCTGQGYLPSSSDKTIDSIEIYDDAIRSKPPSRIA
jgi:hypothetical protein